MSSAKLNKSNKSTESNMSQINKEQKEKLLNDNGDNGVNGNNKLIVIKQKTEDLKTQMHQNIAIALANMEDLEKTQINVENLNANSFEFSKTAKKLKNKMWWQKIKLYAMIMFVVCIILAIIISVAVLMSSNHSENNDSSSSKSTQPTMLSNSFANLLNNLNNLMKFSNNVIKKEKLRGFKSKW